MTLNITSSQIQIKNSLGQIKFNSSDKLVYLKYSTSGTINISGGTEIYVPFQSLDPTSDFYDIQVRFNSSDGNSVQPLLGLNLYANNAINTKFRYEILYNGFVYYSKAESEILSIFIFGSNLIFRPARTQGDTGMGTAPYPATGTHNVSYYAKIYSYL
jgi:hypothetical protein